MKNKPSVGDKVSLNSHGMSMIGGLTTVEQVHDCQDMIVTKVEPGYAYLDCGSPVFVISVDKESIDQFIITQLDIDLIK